MCYEPRRFVTVYFVESTSRGLRWSSAQRGAASLAVLLTDGAAAFSWSLVPARRLNYSTTPGTLDWSSIYLVPMHGRGLNGAWLYPIRTDNHGHPFSCYHLAVTVGGRWSEIEQLFFTLKFLTFFLQFQKLKRETLVRLVVNFGGWIILHCLNVSINVVNYLLSRLKLLKRRWYIV